MIRPPSLPRRPRAARWLHCALAAFAFSLCVPLHALADSAADLRVLLIAPGTDPFLERVGAEVAALGFVLARSDERGPLETTARAAGAVAAIRVLPSRKGVEVWMADSTSGRSLLRQVIVDESPGGPDHDVIALQTAELLRTSLLGEKPVRERGELPSSPAGTVPHETTGAKEPNAREREEGARDATWGDTAVQLGFGALLSPGGTSATGSLALSLQHFFGRSLGLGLDVMLPLLPGSIDELEGSADVNAYLAGATLLWRLAPAASSWFASAGAGGGLLLVRFEGETAAPLLARSSSRATGAAYAHGDVGLALASWLRVGVRALVGVSFERIRVTFAGNAAGSYGPALLSGCAFAGMHWP